jgi:hypothetical protein
MLIIRKSVLMGTSLAIKVPRDVEETGVAEQLSAYKWQIGGVGGNLHPGQGEESRTIR